MKRIASRLLDFFLLIGTLVYTLGGISWNGKLQLTFLHDYWVGISVLLFLARVTLQIHFSDLAFGKAAVNALDALTESVTTKSTAPFKNLSVNARLLLVVFAYSISLFLINPILNHAALGTFVFDLGIIENAVYNFGHNFQFITSYFQRADTTPFFYVPENHFNYGLVFFGIIYRFFAHTEVMLLGQSIAMLSAVIPLFLLSKKLLPKEIPFWFVPAMYLLWDPIHRMNVWDFHEPPFLIPFSIWAFYFIETNSALKFILSVIAMSIWREDGWAIGSAMGLVFALKNRRFFAGAVVMGLSAAIFFYCAHHTFGINDIGGKYPGLGGGIGPSLKTVFTQPWVIFSNISEPLNRQFWVNLLWSSGGGIFLFSGLPLIAALPPIFEVGLTRHIGMLNWSNHYVGLFGGALFACQIYGLRSLHAWLPKNFPVLMCVGALSLSFLGFNESGAFRLNLRALEDRKCLRDFTKKIPAEVKVLAMDPVASQLSNRPWVMLPRADFDQSEAEWLATPDENHLKTVGITGKSGTRLWNVVTLECGWILANRGDKKN